MKKRSRRWSVTDAQVALSKMASSGLSVGAFARREGVDAWRLYRWQRRLGEERAVGAVAAPTTTPAVVELRPSPRRTETVEIVLGSGVTLRVVETIDPSALARLVSVLR